MTLTSTLATVTEIELDPNPRRVIARPFTPGMEDVGPTGSRAGAVVERILHLDEAQVVNTLDEVIARFSDRHRDLAELFAGNADRIMPLIPAPPAMSTARRMLLGAYFTHEYAVEGAALANPSMVRYPDAETRDGRTRFVMSVRCIGEGHRSAIGFRSGTIDGAGTITVDEPSPYLTYATGQPGTHSRRVFHARLDSMGHDLHELSRLLGLLPTEFDDADLSNALGVVASDSSRTSPDLAAHATELSQWSYRLEFPEETDVSERILWPHAPPEYHGMEDARFVRFVEDDGRTTYLATYTAFDRNAISLQLLETADFRRFASSPVAGSAAVGKGLALFPRRIDGRFAALTRADRETNGLAYSDDLRHWSMAEQLQVPHEPWELIQLGNCGSPIETDAGWIVLTHGVGPMRTYSLGALLLDLDDPSVVIGRTRQPVLEPDDRRREGYVPNVVYSCGALAHDDTLVIPFGIADQRIGIATASITELVTCMRSGDR